ncbi:serine/threonine-protein kinase MARK1-like [Tamandua tetradactyla]|uniref:serine/threonine-protein kinase MARK1-like n=1 Tax=Tamandua tetradactyla TaxID=48850 RepID=UPI00405460E0
MTGIFVSTLPSGMIKTFPLLVPLPGLQQLEGGESLSSGNWCQRSQPSSDLNNSTIQSPAHLKVQRSTSANQKQQRFSDHVGPSIPPAVSYTKRPQANSVESEQKEEWDKDVARKLGSTTVGSKSEMTTSPLVGPERKKSPAIPSNNVYPGGSMARRNTYVCERTTDRYMTMQNGKDSSRAEMSASGVSSAGSAVASAVPSARSRHQKSLSASGHPVTATPPAPKDSSGAHRPGSTTQRAPAASPSAHSISASTADRTRFPRGSSSRSTFHGEQLRERRGAAEHGPPASPSHEAGAFLHARRGTSTGIISKLTSRFVRRDASEGEVRGRTDPSSRNQWNDIFKLLKEKNCQPRIPYPTKLPFKNEGEIKTFSEKKNH